MEELRSRGFSLVEVLIALIVLGLIVGAGWFVYSRNDSPTTSQSNSDTTADTDNSAGIREIAVGETGAHNGHEVEVHNVHVENAEYVHKSTKREDGSIDTGKYLVVDFTLTNKTGRAADYAASYFKLETKEGEVLKMQILSADGREWKAPTLVDGASTTGQIAFPLGENDFEGKQLLWESPDWLYEGDTVRINL